VKSNASRVGERFKDLWEMEALVNWRIQAPSSGGDHNLTFVYSSQQCKPSVTRSSHLYEKQKNLYFYKKLFNFLTTNCKFKNYCAEWIYHLSLANSSRPLRVHFPPEIQSGVGRSEVIMLGSRWWWWPNVTDNNMVSRREVNLDWDNQGFLESWDLTQILKMGLKGLEILW
jgi:hypothetical protein